MLLGSDDAAGLDEYGPDVTCRVDHRVQHHRPAGGRHELDHDYVIHLDHDAAHDDLHLDDHTAADHAPAAAVVAVVESGWAGWQTARIAEVDPTRTSGHEGLEVAGLGPGPIEGGGDAVDGDLTGAHPGGGKTGGHAVRPQDVGGPGRRQPQGGQKGVDRGVFHEPDGPSETGPEGVTRVGARFEAGPGTIKVAGRQLLQGGSARVAGAVPRAAIDLAREVADVGPLFAAQAKEEQEPKESSHGVPGFGVSRPDPSKKVPVRGPDLNRR